MSLNQQSEDDLELQINQLLSAVSHVDDNRDDSNIRLGLNQWPWTSDEENPLFASEFISNESSMQNKVQINTSINQETEVRGQNVPLTDGMSIDPDVLRSLQGLISQSTALDINSTVGSAQGSDDLHQAIIDSKIEQPSVDYTKLLQSLSSMPGNSSALSDLHPNTSETPLIFKDKWIRDKSDTFKTSANYSTNEINQDVVQLSIPCSDASLVKQVIQLLNESRTSADNQKLSNELSNINDLNNLTHNPNQNDVNPTDINRGVLNSYQQLISLAQLNNILSIPIQIVNDALVLPVSALSHQNAAPNSNTTNNKVTKSSQSRRHNKLTTKERKKRLTKAQKLAEGLTNQPKVSKNRSEKLNKGNPQFVTSNSTANDMKFQGINGDNSRVPNMNLQYNNYDGESTLPFDNDIQPEINQSTITLHSYPDSNQLLGFQQDVNAAPSSISNPNESNVCPKFFRNKLVSTQPLVHSRSTMCKPVSFHRGTQTSLSHIGKDSIPPTGIVPVPITIAIPIPIILPDSIIPYFIPIPIPVPVPIPVQSRVIDEIKQQSKSACDYVENEVLSEAKLLSSGCCSQSKPEVKDHEKEIFATDEINDESSLKWLVGVRRFCSWITSNRHKFTITNFLEMSTPQLASTLEEFICDIRRPEGSNYSAECIMYTCICLHHFIKSRGRPENIFFDDEFTDFTNTLHKILKLHRITITNDGQILSHINEDLLWESKLLGCHSPFILLNTLFYFNTRFFLLRTVDDHINVRFSDIRQHTNKLMIKGQDRIVGECKYLRYYPARDQQVIYEQSENLSNPVRCAVRLYEFYKSKCPPECLDRSTVDFESTHHNAFFYLEPERTATPDSPIWFTSRGLSPQCVDKMVVRFKLLKEINEAHLTLDAMF